MDWDSVREQVARAMGSVQGRDAALNAANTTLEIAIIEAIVEIDSDQSDSVATLSNGNLIEVSDDGKVRPGQLQRLAALKATFYGDGSGTDGLIAQMKNALTLGESDLSGSSGSIG